MYGILSVPVKKVSIRPCFVYLVQVFVLMLAIPIRLLPSASYLEIGIHGVPVTMQQKIYDDLANGELNGYWDTNLDNPYRNCLQTGSNRCCSWRGLYRFAP